MKLLWWNNPKTSAILAKIIQQGDIILGSGDTVLGLLAAVSPDGIAKLDAIKHRAGKSYLILVRDYKKALGLIQNDANRLFQIEKIMNSCWPGPVTLIFKAHQNIAEYMKSSNGTIALRVPDHPGLLQLLQKCGLLFSTSANSSGAQIPSCIEEVEKSIIDAISCIVVDDKKNGAGEKLLPSTILDCTGDVIKVVRQGLFSIEKLSLLK